MDEVDRFATPNQSSVRCREVYRNSKGNLSCQLGNNYDRKKCINGEEYCEERVTR
jgi:hypothetical protein